ncbi:DUF177 domain-containing protein [Anaerolineales bacterium]
MKATQTHPLKSRILKTNVGFLLAAGPGNSHVMTLDIPEAIRLDDDIVIHSIRGDMRLSRVKEGLLVRGDVKVVIDEECSRCLTIFKQEVVLELEEMYAYQHPGAAEFYIDADGILDLSPLIRAESLLATGSQPLCKAECKGLCSECGQNLNLEPCSCTQDDIDPRMAILQQLLKSDSESAS